MNDDDTWAAVARAAAKASPAPDRTSHQCPVCNVAGVVPDGTTVRVHFAKVTDAKPCLASYKQRCMKCGGLVANDNGKRVHVEVPGSTRTNCAM